MTWQRLKVFRLRHLCDVRASGHPLSTDVLVVVGSGLDASLRRSLLPRPTHRAGDRPGSAFPSAFARHLLTSGISSLPHRDFPPLPSVDLLTLASASGGGLHKLPVLCLVF